MHHSGLLVHSEEKHTVRKFYFYFLNSLIHFLSMQVPLISKMICSSLESAWTMNTEHVYILYTVVSNKF